MRMWLLLVPVLLVIFGVLFARDPHAALLGPAAMQVAPVPADPFPLRRILVGDSLPESAAAELAQGTMTAMPRREFEDLVRRAGLTAAEAKRAPLIVSSLYRATYEPGQLRGTTEWTCRSPGGRGGAVSLDGIRIAISKAMWSGDRPAELIRSTRSNPLSPAHSAWMEAVVEDKLSATWSLRGQVDLDEERFELGVPPAALATFDLLLPAGVAASCAEATTIDGPFDDSSGAKRWRLRLNGLSRATIVVRKTTATDGDVATGSTAALSFKHDMAIGVVRTTVDVQLEGLRASARTATFDLDERAEVREVVGLPAERWSVERGQDRRVVLRIALPEPSPTAKLSISLVAPLTAIASEWTPPEFSCRNTALIDDRHEVTLPPGAALGGWTAGDYRATVASGSDDRTAKISFIGSFRTGNVRQRPIVLRRWPDVEFTSDESLDWRVEPGQQRFSATVRIKVLRGPLPALDVAFDPEFSLEGISLQPEDSSASFEPRPSIRGGWRIVPSRAISTGETVEFKLEFAARTGPPGANASDRLPSPLRRSIPAIDVPGASDRNGTLSIAGKWLKPIVRSPLAATAETAHRTSLTYRHRTPRGEIDWLRELPNFGPTLSTLFLEPKRIVAELRYWNDEAPLQSFELYVPAVDAIVQVEGATATPLPGRSLWPMLGATDGWQALGGAAIDASLGGSWWLVAFPKPLRGDAMLRIDYPWSGTVGPLPLPVVPGSERWDANFELRGSLAADFAKPVQADWNRDLFPPVLVLASPVEPPAEQVQTPWRIAGAELAVAVAADGSTIAAWTGRIESAPASAIPIVLPPGAELIAVEWFGKPMPGWTQNGDIVELPIPNADGPKPLTLRYRLAVAKSFATATIGPVAPAWPIAVSPTESWSIDATWIDAATLAPAERSRAPNGPLLRQRIVDSSSAVLAVAGVALCLSLRSRLRGLALALVAVFCGSIAWLGGAGWAALVAPLLSVALFALAWLGRHRAKSLAAVLAAMAIWPAIAQSPEPISIYFKAVGDDIVAYVPNAVRDRLTALAQGARPPVVVRRATAEGTIEGMAARMAIAYELWCPGGAERKFTLPLSGVRLEAMTIDGEPAFPEAAKPDQFTVLLPKGESHRLRVEFVAVPAALGRERTVRWTGPEAMISTLNFRIGDTARPPEVPSRRGAMERAKDGESWRVSAELGAVAECMIRWSEPAAATVEAGVSVRELAAWDVGECQSSVTQALLVKIGGKPLDRLTLAVPAELRVAKLSVRGTDAASSDVRLTDIRTSPAADGWQPLVLAFAAPIEGQLSIVLKAVPNEPAMADAILRTPRLEGAVGTQRESWIGFRWNGVRVLSAKLNGAIDVPAEGLAKEARGIPELGLDANPPSRVVRRVTDDRDAELRVTFAPPAPPIATAKTSVVLGAWGAVDGTISLAGDTGGHFAFDVPEACTLHGLRGAGLLGWRRSGSRVQAWFEPKRDGIVLQWSGSFERAGDRFEIPLPKLAAGDASTLRVRPAEGWTLRELTTTGLKRSALDQDDIAEPGASATYAADEIVPDMPKLEMSWPPPVKPAPTPTLPTAEPSSAPTEAISVTPSIPAVPWLMAWLAGFLIASLWSWRSAPRYAPEVAIGFATLGWLAIGTVWLAAPFAALAIAGMISRIRRWRKK